MAGGESATQNGCAHLERPPGVIPAIHDSGHGGLVETDIERQVAHGVLEAQRRGLAAEQNRIGCPHAGQGDGRRATLGSGRAPHERRTRQIEPELGANPRKPSWSSASRRRLLRICIPDGRALHLAVRSQRTRPGFAPGARRPNLCGASGAEPVCPWEARRRCWKRFRPLPHRRSWK
jgi:hypothetical protein